VAAFGRGHTGAVDEAGRPSGEARGARLDRARRGLLRLRGELGLDFGQGRRMAEALAAGEDRVSGLVEATGIPYRRVLELLRSIGIEADGDEIRFEVEERASLRQALGAVAAAPPLVGAWGLPGLVGELAAGLPPSPGNLDHVPATEATILRRARYLLSTYELDGAHLVCLGDHDLTSVVTKAVAPGATVSVVDIDERLLRYLGGLSDRLGLDLHRYHADLRLTLPRTLSGSADLVFTDPPYSTEGVAVFLDRAVEALADRPGARIVFCYGTNDRDADKVLAVQEVLAERHLLLEALLPGFNRYAGAHAIGGASALWVCRPTRRTRPAVARLREAAGKAAREGRIYSRGAASRESLTVALEPRVLAAASEAIAEGGGRPVVLVGEGWGRFEPTGGGPVRRLGLGTLFDAATEPPHRGPPRFAPGTILAVSLGRAFGGSFLRLLLAAPAGCRLVVVAPRRDLVLPQPAHADQPTEELAELRAGEGKEAAEGDIPAGEGEVQPSEAEALRRLVGARWRLSSVRAGRVAGDVAVVVAEPADPAGEPEAAFLLRYLAEHQAARVRNAWREGLCLLAARRGASCTKNEARALIERAASRPADLDARLLELPLDRLPALVAEVDGSVARLARQIDGATLALVPPPAPPPGA
jgi:hypothetical protein